MSDWDFLHDMHARGCSPHEIADAAAIGYDPDTEEPLSREWFDDELADQTPDEAQHLARQAREGGGPFQSRSGFPFSMLDQIEIFGSLVDCAERHFQNTGRYLQVWGELGEIYAISPERIDDLVLVKRDGDFEHLLIVRIDTDFCFTGKLIDRDRLSDSGGRYLRARMHENTD